MSNINILVNLSRVWDFFEIWDWYFLIALH